ncbi:hypothetical protein KSP39_PZI021090 [Platanthera zijinensis]|uniref:Ferredoxin-thioredoxin reductase catalytic chain, chloroplastic n=1 Tax=Platanthera zijinensis TaxID=2320716 RepID=A0AAP0FVS3_9ASPA
MAFHHLTPIHQAFVASLSSVVIPNTWLEALGFPAWTRAMKEEMSALDKNHTWDVASLHLGKKAIGSRWMFSVKQNQEGKVERYKARLVAQGYTQTQGVDYQETFAPVAKMDYIRRLDHGIVVLIVYVDDIAITGSDLEEIVNLKSLLFAEFEVKNLGKLRYFLGIEVTRSDQGIFISQRKYVLDLLQETRMFGYVPTNTPIEETHGSCEDSGSDQTDVTRYQRLVGKLIYLSYTCPDITYAVEILSRYMHAPRIRHQEAAYRVTVFEESPWSWSSILEERSGLADHKETLGAPLCPCRHYDDKAAEVAQGFWNCPCVPMRERWPTSISQEVTHPRTTLTGARLTLEFPTQL